MEEGYGVLSRPTVEEVEAAIGGSGPPLMCLCARGSRSVVRVDRLSPWQMRDVTAARGRGYLVHRGQEPDRVTFDAWQTLCVARGVPAIRVWARGVQSSSIEMELVTCSALARLSEAEFERLWALLSEHARVVEGGPSWLCAYGVATDQVETIAAAVADVAERAGGRVWAGGQGGW